MWIDATSGEDELGPAGVVGAGVKSVLQAQVGQAVDRRQGLLTLRCGAPEQGRLEAFGPVGDLFENLPQQEDMREDEGPQAQTATSQR